MILFPADPNESGLKLIECRSPDPRAGSDEQRGLWTHAWEEDEPNERGHKDEIEGYHEMMDRVRQASESPRRT